MLEKFVAEFLTEQTHFVLAVTLNDGTPWAVPLKLQSWNGLAVEWDSKLTTEHSKAIGKRPEVSLCVYRIGSGERPEVGFYAKAKAERIGGDGNGRYRAVITEAWYNGEEHKKVKLDNLELGRHLLLT